MSTAHIEAEDPSPILSEEAFDELDAALAAIEAARSPVSDPEAYLAHNRAIRAPAWLSFDLSDADPLWKAHTCISDDTGACPDCTAYIAAGGVL